jgi:GNAT superfamily N-acetyltransferase
MDQPTLSSVLMGAEDDPVTKRGMLWPFVERQSGKAELGLPSFLHEPWEALKRLQGGSYQPGQPDAGSWDHQGTGDAATLAGALMTGGLGLNFAGMVPKGSVGMAGGSLPKKVFDFTNPGGGSREAKVGHTTIDYGVGKDGPADVILVKTPKQHRGQGSARAAMEQFIREADEEGLRLFLNSDPMDKGVSKARLDAFYKSLGFVKNMGRNKDFSSRAEFVRKAKNKDE